MTKQKRAIRVAGMHCESCEKRIEAALLAVAGVRKAHADLVAGTVRVAFDDGKASMERITGAIEALGYSCPSEEEGISGSDAAVLKAAAVLALIVAAYLAYNFLDTVQLPELTPGMGYGLAFGVGLLTGFHCIAMCGGFVVSYAAEKRGYAPHLLYAAGKTLSYTAIGAAFGLLGSIIAFTPVMRGTAAALAGVFLLAFGLGMLGVPGLNRIRLRPPAFVERYVAKHTGHSASPLSIGLMNGLMIACGPLQAMYVLAAGTGSPIEGASLLFFFGLGTLPAMLGFGVVASMLSAAFTQRLFRASGAVVAIFGLLMVGNGLALAGISSPLSPAPGAAALAPAASLESGYQVIHMNVTRYGWEPNSFVLQQGVPVKWVIDGQAITNCNKRIIVPSLGLEFGVKKGEQTIEFTPNETGTIMWSCWMGMVQGRFIVTSDGSASAEAVQPLVASAGSCGGGCGGGCGAK